MRLHFHEFEWSLSVPWSLQGEGFRKPELLDVSNLGHPLFARLEIPHLIVQTKAKKSPLAPPPPRLLTLDAQTFDLAWVKIMGSNMEESIYLEPSHGENPMQPAGKTPGRLAAHLESTIYGHSANNDLSVWGSQYIRLVYALKHDLAVDYLTLDNAKQACHLWVEIRFQFGPYSWEPPHEPSGALTSARLIPAISFHTNSPLVTALRADVRFDLRMDALHPAIHDAAFPVLGMVSRDAETLKAPSRVTLPLEDMLASAAFAHSEKPLKYEICTKGWIMAQSPKANWDNIHLWPGKKLNGDYIPALPSAPGAFHALHCHWRWAAFLADYWYLYYNSALTPFLKLLYALNAQPSNEKKRAVDPKLLYVWFMRKFFGVLNPANTHGEYQGLPTQRTVTVNMGGPLFDPKIPDQQVSFAIALKKHADLSDAVSFDFVKHFLGGKSDKPVAIQDGAELSWWISFAPHRKIGASSGPVFQGTLFSHGTHFAHNLQEPFSLSSPTRGAGTLERDAAQEWKR